MTAYAKCVFAACVTSSPAAVKLYSLHWTLTGMYSLNTTWYGLATHQAVGTVMTHWTAKLQQQTANRSLCNTLGCVQLNYTCSFLQVLCADGVLASSEPCVPHRKALSPQDFYSVYLSKHNVAVLDNLHNKYLMLYV